MRILVKTASGKYMTCEMPETEKKEILISDELFSKIQNLLERKEQ